MSQSTRTMQLPSEWTGWQEDKGEGVHYSLECPNCKTENVLDFYQIQGSFECYNCAMIIIVQVEWQLRLRATGVQA